MPVYETYGCHEINLVAWECKETGDLHLCDDLAIVEVLCEGRPARPGESGDVVVTNLHAYASPYLRYELGDRAVAGDPVCRCGAPFATIRSVQGRTMDALLLADGRVMHHWELIPMTFWDMPWHRQYQLVQESRDRFVLRLVADGEPPAGDLEHLCRAVLQKLRPGPASRSSASTRWSGRRAGSGGSVCRGCAAANKIGSAMSSWTPPTDTPMVVNLVAYDTKGQRLPPITLDQISDVLKQPDTFVWMGLHEPDEALLEKLQEEFSLHDLAIEDAHNAHQRPKIDVYGDSLFIVLRTAQEVNRHCEFGETHAFLGPRYPGDDPSWASLSYAPVRARVEREPELLALGPSYCFYAVFDFIVDNFMPIVEALPRGAPRARDGDLRARVQPRDRRAPLRPQARADHAAARDRAGPGHLEPADAVVPEPDPRRGAALSARRPRSRGAGQRIVGRDERDGVGGGDSERGDGFSGSGRGG